MRILFAHAAAQYSTYDVGMGYLAALQRHRDVQVRPWRFYQRLMFVARALKLDPDRGGLYEASKLASRMIVEDALEFDADWAIITSGLTFHPAGVWLLRKAGVRVAVILTESPYDDHEATHVDRHCGDASEHLHMADLCNLVATNEITSRERFGWLYLPPAYDPEQHRLVALAPGSPRHDVVIVGTGWDERVERLAAVDWTGVDLGIYGVWPQLGADDGSIDLTFAAGLHPTEAGRGKLGRFWKGRPTENQETVQLYSGAKIVLNDHRPFPGAETLNPRVYEALAVGGGLLLTDYRLGLERLLGPLYREFVYVDPDELSRKVRYFLNPAHEDERRRLVRWGKRCVQGETFDARAEVLLRAMAAVSPPPWETQPSPGAHTPAPLSLLGSRGGGDRNATAGTQGSYPEGK